jgi:uncharacterized protein YecE (DUF72 family)
MLHIGTCSWTEKTLLQSGVFYPKGARTAEDRLRHYASQFDTVEVDSAYYAIPDKRTTSLWTERTPEDFIFHVKAYGALTRHGIKPATLPKDIFSLLPDKDKTEEYVYIKDSSLLQVIAERFREALLPLSESSKLGLLVFQFPPWIHYKPANLDLILRCKELMRGYRLAVEFRHGSWLSPKIFGSVLDFLREHQLSYVTVDEPQFDTPASVPFVPNVTTQIAYFRLHGRNKENWLKKGIETSLRFAHFYTDDELKEFIPSIKEIEGMSLDTYVMFNNCYRGYAMKDALRLKELLREP